jgi:hypothetical protein
MDAARPGSAKRARVGDAPPAAAAAAAPGARGGAGGAAAPAVADEEADAEEEAEGEEEEEEEAEAEASEDSAYAEDNECGDEFGRSVAHAAARAYDAALAALTPAAAAAAAALSRRAGGLTYEDSCTAESEDGERLRSATLRATLRAAGARDARGAELRMVYHRRARSTWCEFLFSLAFRAAGSGPAREEQHNARAYAASWTLLCRAALEDDDDEPLGRSGGMEDVFQYEAQCARGLTPAACAALRRLVFGSSSGGGGVGAAVSDVALLTLAFTAVGAVGLPRHFRLDTGYAWHPSPAQLAAGAPPVVCWLERALRAAAGAPHPWDAHYEPEDVAAERREWRQQMREMDGDDDDDDSDEDEF